MLTTAFQINKCIFCGGKGETNEHILPYALGGKVVLVNASCDNCRALTSKWERSPLHKSWLLARAALDYPSRKSKFDKLKFPLKVTYSDGRTESLKLSQDEIIGLTPFLEYPLPVFFSGSTYNGGVTVIGQRLISFGKMNAESLAKKYGFKAFTFQSIHKGNAFENMVARIAYCCAVARFGLENIAECFVLSAVLGEKDDVGYWMGCDPFDQVMPSIGKIKANNAVKVGIWRKTNDTNKYIVTKLKFFAASDAPEYIVVVGKLKDSFQLSSSEEFAL